MSPPARRPWELLVVAAALVCFALATTLARAETTRLASTTFRGTWLCNWKVDGAFVPLAGARVELLTPYVDLDDFDVIPGNFRVVQVTHTDADGNWSFTFPSDEDGDDHWVRVLTNGNGVPLHDYGARVIHTYRCEVFAGLQRAYDDFVATAGKPPPYGDLDVVSHAITAGVPVTMFTEIWWPADYPVAKSVRETGAAYGYET